MGSFNDLTLHRDGRVMLPQQTRLEQLKHQLYAVAQAERALPR